MLNVVGRNNGIKYSIRNHSGKARKYICSNSFSSYFHSQGRLKTLSFISAQTIFIQYQTDRTPGCQVQFQTIKLKCTDAWAMTMGQVP